MVAKITGFKVAAVRGMPQDAFNELIYATIYIELHIALVIYLVHTHVAKPQKSLTIIMCVARLELLFLASRIHQL